MVCVIWYLLVQFFSRVGNKSLKTTVKNKIKKTVPWGANGADFLGDSCLSLGGIAASCLSLGGIAASCPSLGGIAASCLSLGALPKGFATSASNFVERVG
jgi:hypothetical protein